MRGTRGAHGDLGQEAIFGVVPVLFKERALGFREAFLVLSGYCIATWSYTQGVYLATLVGFRQLLIGAFFGALLMLLIYQLPVILSVRFGIDIWVWLRTVFGGRGVRLMTVLIIVINFPWYAVCADLFASSMTNLAGLLGLETGRQLRIPLCLLCIALGVLIALRGVGAITKATRILVPMLLAAGIVVIIVGCTSVPVGSVWNYRPVHPEGGDRLI
ncbi:MAG: cytosine permease [Clostridiales Family XIII bacterium]|nr:cytosine permease [Clostridiales Family XIII bacterium]